MGRPDWYYPLFDKVFAPSRDYAAEIELVNRIDAMRGRIVEEIGTGTGNHLAEIVLRSPQKARGIDIDLAACRLASTRFEMAPTVEIVCADGFAADDRDVDILVSFYCLPQQSQTLEDCVRRMDACFSRARAAGCSLWVEWMDVDRHLFANGRRPPQVVYEDSGRAISIVTTAAPWGTEIVYSANDHGNKSEYRVPICHLPMELLKVEAARHGLGVEAYPLSPSGRKLMLRFALPSLGG